jgi:hypothetical protein
MFGHQSIYPKSESITSIIGTFVAKVLLPCAFMMKVGPQSVTSIGAFAAKVHLQRALMMKVGPVLGSNTLTALTLRCEGTIILEPLSVYI